MSRSGRIALAAGAAVLAMCAGGAVAYAGIPDNGVYHGCVGEVGGYLRLVEPTDDCISTESAVSWGGGFTNWQVVTGTETINSGWQDITASCDHANGYRLLFATAQQPATGSAVRAVSPYVILTDASDGRPTGVKFRAQTAVVGDSDLDYQLSCVK
jgi:hypothetical protein